MAVVFDALADSVSFADGKFSTDYQHVRQVANPADGLFKFVASGSIFTFADDGTDASGRFTWKWKTGAAEYDGGSTATITQTIADMAL